MSCRFFILGFPQNKTAAPAVRLKSRRRLVSFKIRSIFNIGMPKLTSPRLKTISSIVASISLAVSVHLFETVFVNMELVDGGWWMVSGGWWLFISDDLVDRTDEILLDVGFDEVVNCA